ncbi:MAG: hypothetical protein K2Q06_00290 [Parvularculaceae bacterium]|nr:hypothetical protein [Parvularculaceae bacterium]
MNPEGVSSVGGLQPEEVAALQRELSARAAFERMILASLKGAALCGVVSLALGLAFAAAGGAGLTSLMSVAVGSLNLACVVFFGGFFGAIVVGVPLALLLERAQVRTWPPYLFSALFVNAFIYVVLTGAPPDLRTPTELLFLLPGPLVAFLYLRDVSQVWRRRPAPPAGTNVVRLH